MFRMLKWLAVFLMLVLVTGVPVVLVRARRVVDAPYPDLHASADPAKIERGRYLANGPAHCVVCHGDPEARERGDLNIPLSGGMSFTIPPGTYFAPNLTSDRDTGIARYSDPELARVLRHGVDPRGQVMLPFMAFSDLVDDDVIALLSYLRSLPPVVHEVPRRSLTPLGYVAQAFLLQPSAPSRPVRASIKPAATVEYGEYLATSVANCQGCHTNRNLRDGSYTGPRFAGGFKMEEPNGTFVTPNLTPHPSGRLAGWTEEAFLARFRAGGNPASPMPWAAFKRMTDEDLRALFRFLRSVPPREQPHGD